VESINERLNIRITKRGDAMVQREELQLLQNLKHDRTKPRLLEFADPYLIEIGISDAAGNVKPSRQDKFKQVEEFLRLLVPTVSHSISSGHITAPNAQNPLEIVDLGCGHAYLTFAAHQYFSAKQIPVHVLGIDIREESRIRNTQIAEKLGIAGSIEFRAETIARFQATKVDVAIALHACDTATDDAIAWAVKNNAKMILAAPCCHHELQTQMIAPPQSWDLITRYGLLKERLGDILTDSFRAQILRILGYRVEVIEFVAGEHTPRNLMIRAVKTDAVVNAAEIQKLNELMLQWKMVPVLVSRLRDELNAKGCDF
jgi:SAM-dependent methyltransferase